MPYLIDGHNLVPKVGLRLDAPDDELELVAILQDFGRRSRARIEVFFDGAPPGNDGTKRFGTLTAHFVRAGMTADAAIQNRLQGLGRAAKDWTVVSSDRAVQAAARQARANVLSAEDYARQLTTLPRLPQTTSGKERGLSDEEVRAWLELFRRPK